MANAQLVKDIGVRGGEISDGEFAQNEALKHRLMDDAARHFLVRPERFQPGVLDRRPDQLLVDDVEVDRRPTGGRLSPERHEYEA